MRRSTKAVAVLSAAMLVGAGNIAAHADNLLVDGDLVAPVGASALAFGDVACDTPVIKNPLLAISRQGNTNSQVFNDASSVTITVKSVQGAGLSAQAPAQPISLSSEWEDANNGTLSSAVASAVTVRSTQVGPGSGKIVYTATGTHALTGNTLTRDGELEVSWNTLTCIVNEAPAAPGTPSASSSPNRGAFTLTWGASEDADDDAVTYTIEGKDSNDTEFGPVVSGLTSPSYTFPDQQPGEGTWTYRVKAVEADTEEAFESEWSGHSSLVVVDRSAPNAPSATPDRAPEYTSGTDADWWQGGVTVGFTLNGDAVLADGSAGSGVAFVATPQVFTASGPFQASGTATDKVGHESPATTFSGNVDATAPVVTVAAHQKLRQGSSASVTWNASDLHSGLSTASTGTVDLDTSVVGSHTVTIPAGTAVDNVGNQSAAVQYTYSVVYNFTGFFQPVDIGGKMNVAKAGSAIPIKFSLGGNQGLNVLDRAPTFILTGVATNGDPIETTVTAGSSSLSYDPVANQYVYVWKTDKAWAGKSGVLNVKLVDGETYSANFSFTK